MVDNLLTSQDELKALKTAYLKQLTESSGYKPPTGESIVSDIGSAYKGAGGGWKGTGAAILAGLSGTARYLGETGGGKQILSGLTKSPGVSASLAKSGKEQLPYDIAQRQAYDETKTGKLSALGKYIGTEEQRLAKIGELEGGALTPAEKYKRETDLRKEVNKEIGDYPKVAESFQRIKAVSNDPSAAGDLALIFNFMKMLDPASVVRESEFATAQNAAGVPERTRALYNRVVDGKRLSDVTRSDFLNQSKNLYDSRTAQYEQTIDEYSRIAEVLGLDPTNIIIQRGFVGDVGEQADTVDTLEFSNEEEAQAAGLTPGTKFMINGRPAIWE